MNLPKTSISDRRAHERHAIRTAAQISLPNGRLVPARTLDVGVGGAGVVCDLNLPVGTALAVRMKLPARPSGSVVFEASAVTKNCTFSNSDDGFRLGLEFESLSAAAMDALKGL